MNQLEQLKKIHHRRRRHGRLPVDQGLYAAGRNDQSFLDPEGGAKAGIPAAARADIRDHPQLGTSEVIDRLLIAFGIEILKSFRAGWSTEVDAALSFDTAATVAKGRELIALYEETGVGRRAHLIKIAFDLEGIAAARSCSRKAYAAI